MPSAAIRWHRSTPRGHGRTAPCANHNSVLNERRAVESCCGGRRLGRRGAGHPLIPLPGRGTTALTRILRSWRILRRTASTTGKSGVNAEEKKRGCGGSQRRPDNIGDTLSSPGSWFPPRPQRPLFLSSALTPGVPPFRFGFFQRERHTLTTAVARTNCS